MQTNWYTLKQRLLGKFFDALDYGDYLLISCPSPDHNDKTASCFINAGDYNCVACGYRGQTRQLLGQEVKQKYGQKERQYWNIFSKFDSLRDLFEKAKRQYHYLTKRGIQKSIIDKVNIKYLEGYYLFPCDNGKDEFAGAVARNILKSRPFRYVVPKDQPDMLFIPDMELVSASPFVILVFGIIDALTLYQFGLPAISTTHGTNCDTFLLQDFRKTIFISPDRGENDKGHKLVSQLDWRGQLTPFVDEYKDHNDFFLDSPNTYKVWTESVFQI